MTKWGRKKTSESVFSKLWISTFKNVNGSEGREPEAESSDGRTKANKISALNQPSDDGFYNSRLSSGKERDKVDESLCGSDHKLNVSPVGYGSFDKMIFDQTKIRGLIGEEEEEEDDDVEDPNMEIKSKDQNHRKSFHIRNYSSRTAACKIRAFEDMKKPMMKKTKERVTEDAFRAGFDSFAIVKTSFDPQGDFRDSMIEMIMEKRIKEPEELEELLACYLTLNCDVYHDLIVKVFRQVWFDLKHLHFDQELVF